MNLTSLRIRITIIAANSYDISELELQTLQEIVTISQSWNYKHCYKYLQCLIVGIAIIARNSYNILDCKQKDRELRLNQRIRFLYEFYYGATAAWVGHRPSRRQPLELVPVTGSHADPPLAGQRSSRQPLELRSHGATAAWVGRQPSPRRPPELMPVAGSRVGHPFACQHCVLPIRPTPARCPSVPPHGSVGHTDRRRCLQLDLIALILTRWSSPTCLPRPAPVTPGTLPTRLTHCWTPLHSST
jgi:hypothetical protein